MAWGHGDSRVSAAGPGSGGFVPHKEAQRGSWGAGCSPKPSVSSGRDLSAVVSFQAAAGDPGGFLWREAAWDRPSQGQSCAQRAEPKRRQRWLRAAEEEEKEKEEDGDEEDGEEKEDEDKEWWKKCWQVQRHGKPSPPLLRRPRTSEHPS